MKKSLFCRQGSIASLSHKKGAVQEVISDSSFLLKYFSNLIFERFQLLFKLLEKIFLLFMLYLLDLSDIFV